MPQNSHREGRSDLTAGHRSPGRGLFGTPFQAAAPHRPDDAPIANARRVPLRGAPREPRLADAAPPRTLWPRRWGPPWTAAL